MGASPAQGSLHISHYQQEAVLQQKLGQSPSWPQAGDSARWWQEELEARAGCCFIPLRGWDRIHAGVFHSGARAQEGVVLAKCWGAEGNACHRRPCLLLEHSPAGQEEAGSPRAGGVPSMLVQACPQALEGP